MVAAKADANGIVRGQFQIPANVRAGTKRVQFIGSGGSYGEARFTGQGRLITENIRRVTEITEWRWWWWNTDPLAQTFTPDRTMMAAGVDIWVGAIGGSDVEVQIRGTSNGFPNRNVIASARMRAADLVADSWNNFKFDTPALLDGGTEYAVVVLCDDADTTVGIAELGKWDSAHGRWITSQAYQVGVLLSSSNASTWTAHQDRDLAFRLYEAVFTQGETVVDLGSATVSNATDLLVLGVAQANGTNATVEYRLTLPTGRVMTVGDGQHIQLDAPVSGSVNVKAVLRSDAGVSAVIWPGTQLVAGTIRSSGVYVTRAIPATNAARLIVVYDAAIPSGAKVTAEYQVDNAATWMPLASPTTSPSDIEGFTEYEYVVSALTAKQVRVRLTLNGSAAARPRVRNIRVLTAG